MKKELADYIGRDLAGYLYNMKYPPNVEKYGIFSSGYPDGNRETLFYSFAVQGYDLEFSYNGKKYYCLSEANYVALCDEHFTEEYQRFKHGNDFIENFEIDGHKLIDIIDELYDVEPI